MTVPTVSRIRRAIVQALDEGNVFPVSIIWYAPDSRWEKDMLRSTLEYMSPEQRERIAALCDEYGTAAAKELRDSIREMGRG